MAREPLVSVESEVAVRFFSYGNLQRLRKHHPTRQPTVRSLPVLESGHDSPVGEFNDYIVVI